MRPDEVKKVNDLARSLKDNRLAANLEEAMTMAKRMLLSDTAGEARAEDQFHTENRLAEVVEDHHEKATIEAVKEARAAADEASKELDEDAVELESLRKEMHRETEELEKIKQDIEALKEIIDNAPETAKAVEKDLKKEDIADKR